MESFEREYYDLIRSAFLKYRYENLNLSNQMNSNLFSFQVRIGNMDGVIVAYHNTARMFWLQYIPLQETDEALFGLNPRVGVSYLQKVCRGFGVHHIRDHALFPKPGAAVLYFVGFAIVIYHI